ncbi:MAG: hypothetical protein J6B07_01115 [Opitutales bacterium]|nr:hypothetical protein [Opitutales bacterium]
MVLDRDGASFMEFRFTGLNATFDLGGKTITNDLNQSQSNVNRRYLVKSVNGICDNSIFDNGTLISKNSKFGYSDFFMGAFTDDYTFNIGNGTGTNDTLFIFQDQSFQAYGGNVTKDRTYTTTLNINSDAVVTSNASIYLGYNDADTSTNNTNGITASYRTNNSEVFNIYGKVGTYTYNDGTADVTSTTTSIRSASSAEVNIMQGGSTTSTSSVLRGKTNIHGSFTTTSNTTAYNGFYVGDTGTISVGGKLLVNNGDFTMADSGTGKVTSLVKEANIYTDGYVDIGGVIATSVFRINGSGGDKANGGYVTAVISGQIISANNNFKYFAIGDDASKLATIAPASEIDLANGNFTVTSTAKLYGSVLYIKGNGSVLTMQAKFYDDKVQASGGGISIRNNSTLVLDAIDVNYDTTHARQYDLGTKNGQNATIDIRKSNRIRYIGFADNKQTLTIDLSNGVAEEGRALVEFDQLTKVNIDIAGVSTNTVALAEGNIINFKGFENGLVWFSKDYVDSEVWREDFRFVTFDGVAVDDESFYYGSGNLGGTGWEWVEKQINGRDGFLFTIPQVPEPAEWAMIFGAIALGFVAYRRRK